jgi:alpha-beta hydrolase superfamily lysophospholipase
VRNTREQTLDRTAFLTAAGYRCVAFDHRAHGQSDGRRTSFGYYESRDVSAALGLVRQRWPGQPLVALGISMGAAALCYAAAEARTCDAIILESLYHDIRSAFSNRIGVSYPAWFRRLNRGVVWITERRLKLRMGQLAPAEHIGALAPAPVLLLTGTADSHAPPEDARRLYERCRGPRELWFVPQAAHGDVFQTGGLPYQQRVLSFLDRWLPRAA